MKHNAIAIVAALVTVIYTAKVLAYQAVPFHTTPPTLQSQPVEHVAAAQPAAPPVVPVAPIVVPVPIPEVLNPDGVINRVNFYVNIGIAVVGGVFTLVMVLWGRFVEFKKVWEKFRTEDNQRITRVDDRTSAVDTKLQSGISPASAAQTESLKRIETSTDGNLTAMKKMLDDAMEEIRQLHKAKDAKHEEEVAALKSANGK